MFAKDGVLMLKLNFVQARLLAAEFQKKFAAFIMKSQVGRIGGQGQAYRCVGFGLLVEYGLRIEVDLSPADEHSIASLDCIDLPETEFVGQVGTIPICYAKH